MQIHDHTPKDDFTIAGETFKVFQPFAEGHVLTANEAQSLNQTFSENVRNNFAKRIKEAKEADAFDSTAMQTALDKYMSGYEFGVRRGGGGGGGRTADPVGTRSLDLARDAVRRKIREIGGNLKDYSAADITARAKKAIESNPRFRATAEKQIEDEKSIGDIGALEVDSQASDEKPARQRKAAAE